MFSSLVPLLFLESQTPIIQQVLTIAVIQSVIDVSEFFNLLTFPGLFLNVTCDSISLRP